ncbi:MAG: iron-sulfur cluster assembly protein [Thermodesulfobacteriota bacterium]|nr:iron-sulfur cluster assembly protein [Thermodesulfobacteriota bacterium]
MDLKEKVIGALQGVRDPGTGMDVLSMGLIGDLQVLPEGDVSFKFRPSSPVCPLVFSLVLNVQKTLKEIDEVENLEITVTSHQKADELNNFLKEQLKG